MRFKHCMLHVIRTFKTEDMRKLHNKYLSNALEEVLSPHCNDKMSVSLSSDN